MDIASSALTSLLDNAKVLYEEYIKYYIHADPIDLLEGLIVYHLAHLVHPNAIPWDTPQLWLSCEKLRAQSPFLCTKFVPRHYLDDFKYALETGNGSTSLVCQMAHALYRYEKGTDMEDFWIAVFLLWRVTAAWQSHTTRTLHVFQNLSHMKNLIGARRTSVTVLKIDADGVYVPFHNILGTILNRESESGNVLGTGIRGELSYSACAMLVITLAPTKSKIPSRVYNSIRANLLSN